MPEARARSALELRAIEKHHGGLRPFRLRELSLGPGSRTALLGFDAATAEVFVNLVSGAILPDKGEVTTLSQRTADITDGDTWLQFVERIGFVSDRVVLLDAMTVAQNL